MLYWATQQVVEWQKCLDSRVDMGWSGEQSRTVMLTPQNDDNYFA